MKNELSRRRFIAAAGLGAAGAAHASLLPGTPPQPAPPRKFYVVLSLGRIGFNGTFQQSVELAAQHGFEGVDPDAEYFSHLSDDQLKKLLDDLKARNLKLGAAGLPVDFRKDEQTFSEDLRKLPAAARVLRRGRAAREHMDSPLQRRSDLPSELPPARLPPACLRRGAPGSWPTLGARIRGAEDFMAKLPAPLRSLDE